MQSLCWHRVASPWLCDIHFGFRGGIFLTPVENKLKAMETMTENFVFTHAPLSDPSAFFHLRY